MELPAAALNIALAWAFGLVVLGLMWWQSMPARNLAMTAIAGASLLAALATGASSFFLLLYRMRRGAGPALHRWSTAPTMAALLLGLLIVPYLSFARTGGDIANLAPINLAGEQIVIRPDGWLPRDIARNVFPSGACARDRRIAKT